MRGGRPGGSLAIAATSMTSAASPHESATHVSRTHPRRRPPSCGHGDDPLICGHTSTPTLATVAGARAWAWVGGGPVRAGHGQTAWPRCRTKSSGEESDAAWVSRRVRSSSAFPHVLAGFPPRRHILTTPCTTPSSARPRWPRRDGRQPARPQLLTPVRPHSHTPLPRCPPQPHTINTKLLYKHRNIKLHCHTSARTRRRLHA